MSNRYSAALVGCGKIGSLFADDPLMKGDVFSHAEAYTVCPATDLVAVVDSDATALDKCGERWSVESRFLSVTEMLDSMSPDIVSVATPTSSHFAICAQLLSREESPRAILCEKPIAQGLPEAERIVALAREKGVMLVVMHMRRYADNMRNLRTFLRDGGIGELRNVSGWLTKGTLHNGTHWFDLLRYLVGEVQWVHGIDSLHEGGDDPTLDVAMGMANGMLATMRSAEVGNFTICEMDIMGSKGRAQIVDSSYRVDIRAHAILSRYGRPQERHAACRRGYRSLPPDRGYAAVHRGRWHCGSQDSTRGARVGEDRAGSRGRPRQLDRARRMSVLAINGGNPVRATPFPRYNTIGEEEKRAVEGVLNGGILSGFLGTWSPAFYGGTKVQQLERDWESYFGVKHAVTVNSATSGLYAAVGAARVGPGDEVIVSPYTMTASASAAIVYGAIPVFADIDEETFCITPRTIRERITPYTKAIIVVDLLGHPA